MSEPKKKLNDATTVTAVADPSSVYVPLLKPNENANKIAVKNLIGAFIGNQDGVSALTDGVMIAAYSNAVATEEYAATDYRRWPRAIRLGEWDSYKNSYTPFGILVAEGDKHVVVALDEPSETMNWSTVNKGTGNYIANTVGGYPTLLADFGFKAKTAAAYALDAGMQGNDVAVGYCYNYEFRMGNVNEPNPNKWGLPTAGELHMIHRHLPAINYALSLTAASHGKGTALQKTYYWSSTESYSSDAWNVGLSNGSVRNYSKSTYEYRVRAVSAFTLY